MNDKAKINKFLTEYFGLCWHEFPEGARRMSSVGGTFWEIIGDLGPMIAACVKCKKGSILGIDNPDFFTPYGFFELIKMMKEKGMYVDFIDQHGSYTTSWDDTVETFELDDYFINPDTFAPAVAKFLGYQEGK